MINLTLWVLLMPLLGFIILGIIGRAFSRRAVVAVAWTCCGLAFLFAAFSFFSMLGTPASARTSDQVFYTWAVSDGLQVNFGLFFDPLAATMLLIITGVGFVIHVYSAGYMEDDPGFWRFFAYLNFFIFAMVLLVSADNFLFLLIGWGLVGLASFLLIGFWFQRPAAVAAAQKAFVINVIGDFGLMIGIFFIFRQYGVINYFSSDGFVGVFSSIDPATKGQAVSKVIALCLFVACAAKSAQLPLYMWLPDAMEGPTPVSALIHAATMVTAGVYLVARAHVLFELAPTMLLVITVIGAVTAIFAASIALFQLDIKRVLAYSTISQLGYMFMGEGVNNYTSGIFQLTTHAYFKALLFLGAGAVIHALAGEQDMRQMGGLRNRLPITFWTFLIAALAISGIPPLSGFWSKDDILSSVLAQAAGGGGRIYYVIWAIGIVTAGLTAFYMFRLFFGIFLGSYRGTGRARPEEEEEPSQLRAGERFTIHEAHPVMTVPLIILAVLSAVGGFVDTPFWQPLANFLAPVFSDGATLATLHPASASVELLSAIVSLVFAIAGIFVAWRLFGQGFQHKESSHPLYQLLFHKYYVDEILSAVIVQPVLWFGRNATRYLEGGLFDGGSRAIAGVLRGTSAGLRRLQTGYMRNYALAILIGVVLIIVYYAVRG